MSELRSSVAAKSAGAWGARLGSRFPELARRIALGACAMFACAGPALAANGFVTEVTAVLPSVTRGQGTAAYEVKITNNKPNAIAGVRLTGTTTVVGASATASFAGSTGTPVCSAPTVTSVDCQIDSLPGGGGVLTFTVAFSSPAAGDHIDFEWRSFFDESGTGGADDNIGTETIALIAANPDSVSTFLVAGESTVRTGSSGGTATNTDQFTTTVVVQAAAQGTTAAVLEAIDPESCAPDLVTCFTSTITIPSTNGLEITLRRDASTIANGAKIANAVVFYYATALSAPFLVPACIVGLPQLGMPCIESRTAYPKRNTKRTPVEAGYEGDWQFVIRAVDNGRYRN